MTHTYGNITLSDSSPVRVTFTYGHITSPLPPMNTPLRDSLLCVTLTYGHIILSNTAYVTLTDGYITLSDFLAYVNFTKGHSI